MSDSGVHGSEDRNIRIATRRIWLTLVDLFFVYAEDVKTKRVLHLLRDSQVCRYSAFCGGKQRPRDLFGHQLIYFHQVNEL